MVLIKPLGEDFTLRKLLERSNLFKSHWSNQWLTNFSYNAFHAFIDLEIEYDARPTLLQIADLVSKGIWRVEKRIEEMSLESLNPPSAISKNLSVMPRRVGAGLSWLFPTEKQRGVLGWVMIAGILASILRFVFGVHLEQIGTLLAKWFGK